MPRTAAPRGSLLLLPGVLLVCVLPAYCMYGPIDGGLVCGEDGMDYNSKEEAHLHGVRAMHGGRCGECSTPHDINVYYDTRNTLTKFTTRCSFLYLMFGEWAMRKCMQKVNFTPGCNECWLENIKCDVNSKCLWICLKSTLSGESNNKGDGTLNSCLQCDEDVCGPAYIRCAGANRRRSGITSDIDRATNIIWEGDDWDGDTVTDLLN
mmetsp:Transcript_10531/g.29976  ORF Transcript_10531/g.29976 Transcript_10531/m.29976 type:complete len:208 (+) Transcript_10531:349-972(+)|eukprot:CAMPEP_0117666698 /NCGR_PEP_ID=MMETSP0804-20121206/10528_1 /TAXON_ID=1074897 /ORGANISM="Tetraselmis astigmatica, Strain CCMP880" /LENGTH=207 /DNA_ID=CAMNT_0005474287 /DNA_START=322 /DNA_END=945 /DNA_ORIENTATION=+